VDTKRSVRALQAAALPKHLLEELAANNEEKRLFATTRFVNTITWIVGKDCK
jgi:hypothetical protein